MPATKRYPNETKAQFEKRMKTRRATEGAETKHPRYAPFDIRRREQIREQTKQARGRLSNKEAKAKLSTLKGRYGEMTKTGRNTGTDRYAQLRVRIRALLGAQAAKHGVARRKKRKAGQATMKDV